MDSSPSRGRTVPFVLSALVLAACASMPPGPTPTDVGTTTLTSAVVPRESGSTGARESAQVVPRPADGPDHHALATANANRVLEGLHPDLLACYARRVATHPNAHAYVTFDVIIGPDGSVRHVETTGGALLGDATLDCLEKRIRQATFAPPHGGGTLRIHVPFTLRRAAPGEDS